MKQRLLVFLCFALTGCLEGTDTGNPGIIADPDAVMIEFTNDIDRLVYYTCFQLQTCLGTQYSACRPGLLEQTNIDTEIGLSQGDYQDLQAVREAVEDQVISTNPDNLNQCLQDVLDLDCQSSKVQGAVDENSQNPFEGVADMLPTSCEQTF